MSTTATSTRPGSKSAAEIEREVQQSRADIEHTLDAIQERLSPGQLVDQAIGYFRGGRGVDFARNLGDSLAANPIPVALMGVGLAWMMFGQRPARADVRGGPEYWDEDLDPIEQHYTGFVDEDMAYLAPETEWGGSYGEDRKQVVQPLAQVLQRGSVSFGAASPTAAAEGWIIVEVPHWAARVDVLDSMLRAFAEASPPERVGPGRYATRVQLPANIYTVEASLGSTTVRQSVVVAPGTETRVKLGPPDADDTAEEAEGAAPSADAPPTARDVTTAARAKGGRLRLASPAPLADTPTAREWHTLPAVEWSRRLTWAPPDRSGQGGDAGLFVFVRTLQPERFQGFADGLTLLDEDGQDLTQLAGEAVERDDGRGWLAFSARLRPGPYVLRREQRSDVTRLRHQPLYLCAGWDAQVFLAAERSASLGSMALHIVRRGAGFDPADRAAAATQALFDALRADARAAAALVSPALLSEVRRGQAHAPWLAVLAAYALRAAAPDRADGRSPDLLQELIEDLDARIGDHPDVRALRLNHDERAAAPFTHPPMLRAGLGRVLRHATRFADTVPAGSLTDRVAGALVTNSPWTAWRDLERRSALARPPATGREALLARLLEGALSAKAPVFPVPPMPAAMKDRPASDAGPVSTGAEGPIVAPVEAIVSDLPLITTAQSLKAAVDAGETPEPSVTLDPARAADELLARVQPPEVSAAAGLPLARIERGLERLRRVAHGTAGAAPAWQDDALEPELATAEAALVEQALRLSAGGLPASGAMMPTTETSLTIETSVRALQAEAEGLKQVSGAAPEASTSGIVGRLERAAEALLHRADLVAITDENLRLRYANGALLTRMEAAGDPLGGWPGLEAALREERLRGEAPSPAARGDSDTAETDQQGAPPATGRVVLSAIRTEADGAVRGYVAIVRGREARVAPEVLAGIDRLLPQLTLYATLYAQGSAQQRATYRGSLEAVVSNIEGLIGIDACS